MCIRDSYVTFEEIIRFRDWDFCQIQLNYMDANIQAGLKGLALARRLGVPVVVMEPVKGGSLTMLPEDIRRRLAAVCPCLLYTSTGQTGTLSLVLSEAVS